MIFWGIMAKKDKYYDEAEVAVRQFKCKKCEHEWGELTEEEEVPECPECKSTKTKKKS